MLLTEVYQTMKILSNYEFCYFINFAESGIIALKMVLPEEIKAKIAG
jgi:hypothetical protein